MFDKQLSKLRSTFNINQAEDWQLIRPEWILAQPGVGEATLQHLRYYLASLGITLQNDGSPNQWIQLLGKTRFAGMQVSNSDESEVCPFTILIDQQEKNPFTFDGLKHDSDNDHRPLVVPIEFRSLGTSRGDYTIAGWEGHVSIERKSMNDAHGTFLGWSERRERFERELEYLAGCECSAVVIECTRGQLLASAPATTSRTPQQNAKSLQRTVISWESKYRVPFVFCDSRRMAEVDTFRRLQMFFRKKVEEAKQAASGRSKVDSNQVEEMLAKL